MHNDLTYEFVLDRGLEAFPELKPRYGNAAIEMALIDGPYILYEDFIVPIVAENRKDDLFLERTALYLEKMLESEDKRVNNLGELALLEGFVINDIKEISPWLLEKSRASLYSINERINFDLMSWLGPKKSN